MSGWQRGPPKRGGGMTPYMPDVEYQHAWIAKSVDALRVMQRSVSL